MKALIGRKIGMTQSYGDRGRVEPVTLLAAGPCVVTQLRSLDKDGYAAVQLGFGESKKIAKSLAGHLKLSGAKSHILREFRLSKTDQQSEFKVGDQLDVTQFEAGQLVGIVGTSKGKGFAGTIKRHNFHRGPKTHGSKSYRAPGSIGSMYPQKIFKGKKMAGRMGTDRVTLHTVKVIDVDPAENLLVVKGPIPGANKSIVTILGE